MVVDPNIFTMEQFHGRFFENVKRHCNRSHYPECDLHAVADSGIFKVVFEIVCGPGLLEFFQAENFVALAGLDMNGVLVGSFCFGNKGGNFGNTLVIVLG